MSDYIESVRIVLGTVIDAVSEELLEEARDIVRRIKPRKPRSCWERKWISRRIHFGASKLLEELATEDNESFKNHLRMSEEKFEELLRHISPAIQKSNTKMRSALPARLKLQIALRYLATGDSFASLQYMYRVPKCTISKFIPQVCNAIFEALKDYVKVGFQFSLLLYFNA